MLKLVIVDDEPMERTYMKQFINWSSMGIEIAGEAANGVDGLKICSIVKPDIILTDIKMPEMDGLEFSRKVKEILPDIKVVFISGHGDFDYARSAVDLNAFGYILKPFRIEEVMEVVRKVLSKCDDEQKKEDEREQLRKILDENKGILKDSLIRELMDGTDIGDGIWERINYLGLKISKGIYCVMLLEVDEYENAVRNMTVEEKQIFSLSVLEKIRQKLDTRCMGEAVKVSGKNYIILLSIPGNVSKEFSAGETYSVAESVKSRIEEMNITVTIGISSTCDELNGLSILHEEARNALQYKLFNMKGQIINIDYLQFSSANTEIDLKMLDNKVVKCLRLGSPEKVYELMNELFDSILPSKNISGNYIQNVCISIMCSAMRFLNEINCTFDDVLGDGVLVWNKLLKFETIADVKQWMTNIFAAIIETVNLKKKSKNQMIVDKIIEIMNEKYSEDLTTKELSKVIFISPNYIGAIFKEETGIGILTFLTKLRMEKAEEMLKDPNMKVYEIAQKVGYNNTPYFSTIFRDYTGMAPSEYRERLIVLTKL